LLRTTDGGISWAKQNIETPKGFFLSLYCVKVRGDYGWAVGNSGLMLHTTDGGNTWQLADVPVQLRSLWFRDISLLPGGRGFIVGSSGAVLAVAGEQFTPLKKRF
jgi:photosystem II stability/assembly factor-like uncharacterized protein